MSGSRKYIDQTREFVGRKCQGAYCKSMSDDGTGLYKTLESFTAGDTCDQCATEAAFLLTQTPRTAKGAHQQWDEESGTMLCNHCSERKQVDAFDKDGRLPSGRRSTCKVCVRLKRIAKAIDR